MRTVWWVFEIVAVLLAAAGLLALARRGGRGRVSRTVGLGLLVLAGATAGYPSLLGPLGPGIWAAGYAVIVAVLTVSMTVRSVRTAGRPAVETASGAGRKH